MLITGVRFRPSGSGERSSSVDLRNTRMPLAESVTAARPTMVSRRAKNRLPMRRMSGISVSSAGQARADDEIGPVLDDFADQVRELLGRVGRVAVEESDQLVRRGRKAGLERRAVAAVDLMPDESHLRELGDDLGRAVLRPVVDRDHLQLVDADPLEVGFEGQAALEGLGDGVAFVVNRDADGETRARQMARARRGKCDHDGLNGCKGRTPVRRGGPTLHIRPGLAEWPGLSANRTPPPRPFSRSIDTNVYWEADLDLAIVGPTSSIA